MDDDELARAIAALSADYASELPGMLAQMEDLWQRPVTAEAAPSKLAELSRMAHNIAGAGTTFGLPRVSAAARDLERFLDRLGESGLPPGAAERAAGMALLAALRQAALQR